MSLRTDLPRELGSTLHDIERRLSGLPMRSAERRVTYERHRRGIFGERHEVFSYESRVEFQELTSLILAGARDLVHEALLERRYWTEDAILLARRIDLGLAQYERRLELAAHQAPDQPQRRALTSYEPGGWR